MAESHVTSITVEAERLMSLLTRLPAERRAEYVRSMEQMLYGASMVEDALRQGKCATQNDTRQNEG